MKAAIFHRRVDFVAGGGDKFEPAFGQAVGKNANQSRCQIIVKVVDDPKAEGAEMGQIHHCQFTLRHPQFAQNRLGPDQKAAPRGRQDHRAFPVIDKISTQRLFQVAQLLADRRLAQPCLLRRNSDRTAFGQGFEHFQPAQGYALHYHDRPLPSFEICETKATLRQPSCLCET